MHAIVYLWIRTFQIAFVVHNTIYICENCIKVKMLVCDWFQAISNKSKCEIRVLPLWCSDIPYSFAGSVINWKYQWICMIFHKLRSIYFGLYSLNARWRHQMETFSALLAICARNSSVPGEFPAQRPVTQSFDVFFDLRLNKRLNKQSSGWWFEMPSCPLWRHCNVLGFIHWMVRPISIA